MTLIGCICAYNEAPLIKGAINSLFAVGCDRVVVVDGQWNGFAPDEPYYSTDDTQNVAMNAGAEVIDPPGKDWPNQVAARNAYLIGKPGDWYLVCDADERCHGTLPTLNDDTNAYWVEVKGAGGAPLSPTRLFRHAGRRVEYWNRHYLIYVDGVAMAPPTLTAYAFSIQGVDRNDLHRDKLKAAFYPAQMITERGGDPEHPRPILKAIPAVHLGRLTYIGNGSFIPGVPARDLEFWESDLHYAVLVANLTGPRPIYATPELPAQPETRRKTTRRKE